MYSAHRHTVLVSFRVLLGISSSVDKQHIISEQLCVRRKHLSWVKEKDQCGNKHFPTCTLSSKIPLSPGTDSFISTSGFTSNYSLHNSDWEHLHYPFPACVPGEAGQLYTNCKTQEKQCKVKMLPRVPSSTDLTQLLHSSTHPYTQRINICMRFHLICYVLKSIYGATKLIFEFLIAIEAILSRDHMLFFMVIKKRIVFPCIYPGRSRNVRKYNQLSCFLCLL